jgi:hypothetical protein
MQSATMHGLWEFAAKRICSATSWIAFSIDNLSKQRTAHRCGSNVFFADELRASTSERLGEYIPSVEGVCMKR